MALGHICGGEGRAGEIGAEWETFLGGHGSKVALVGRAAERRVTLLGRAEKKGDADWWAEEEGHIGGRDWCGRWIGGYLFGQG